jgi:hypothetical protein
MRTVTVRTFCTVVRILDEGKKRSYWCLLFPHTDNLTQKHFAVRQLENIAASRFLIVAGYRDNLSRCS